MANDMIIDLHVLQDLRDLQSPNGPDIVKELMTLFIKTADPIASKINASKSDFHVLSAQAHTLKSAAAGIGALRLSETCFILEKVGLGQLVSDDINKEIENFNNEYKLAISAIKEYLNLYS